MDIRQSELGFVFVECFEYLRRGEGYAHGTIDYLDINEVNSVTFFNMFVPMTALQGSPDQETKNMNANTTFIIRLQ